MRTLHINVIAVAIGIILFFVVAFVHAEPVVKCEPWSQTKCACHQKEDPKTGKCKKDANTYGCPCLDVTNGHPTPGTCITPEANGPNPHCKGSGEKPKGEGKPPEIPKPPESKPKEDKPKDQNQKPCNATSTPNVSGMGIGSGGTNVVPDGMPGTDRGSGGGGIANAFELPRSLSTQGENSTCTFGTNTSQLCAQSLVGESDALSALRALAGQTGTKSLWLPEEIARMSEELRGLEGWMKTQTNSLSPGGSIYPETSGGGSAKNNNYGAGEPLPTNVPTQQYYYYGTNGEIILISPGAQNGENGGRFGEGADPYVPQSFGTESTFGAPERTTQNEPKNFTYLIQDLIERLMRMLGMK